MEVAGHLSPQPHHLVCGGDMSDELERLRKENDILRGIATKVMPCHYCGAEELNKCPQGFPGCSLADDITLSEHTHIEAMRNKIEKLLLKEFGQPVAWMGELATSMDKDGNYCDWSKPRLFDHRPHVPEGAIRNLRPLYAGEVEKQ